MEAKKNKKEESSSYLTFRMNSETYAIDVTNVQIILELSRITKIPKTPDYFLGIIDLRGAVLPVIDLRVKLGMKTFDNTINTCILVLEIGIDKKTINLGVLVDAVEEVIEITHDQVQVPPEIGNSFSSEFLEGLYKPVDKSFIMILNVNKIFSINELIDISDLSEEMSVSNQVE